MATLATSLTIVMAEGADRGVSGGDARRREAGALPHEMITVAWPDAATSMAASLCQFLAEVPTVFVYVPPFDFAPVPRGLSEVVSLLQKHPAAVSAGALTVACQPTAGHADAAVGPEGLSWQIALTPVALHQLRAPPRLRALGRAFRPFTGYVHRTAALQRAVAAVAKAEVRDRWLEEMLISFELAMQGRLVATDSVVVAIGSIDRFAACRAASSIYGRFLDLQWFQQLSPLLQDMAARLHQDDWLDRFGLRKALRHVVSRTVGGRSLHALTADELLRSVFGDALFAMMADRVVSPPPSGPGLGGLLRDLQVAGWSKARLLRLEDDIKHYCHQAAGRLSDGIAAPYPDLRENCRSGR